MPRRPDFKAGSVLSFRIPENISPEDLEHLRRIAKRPTTGKAGAVSEFFFAKVAEDRVQQSRHVTIALPDLTDDELHMLDNPMFKKALALYAYQLLGRSVAVVGRVVPTEDISERLQTEDQQGDDDHDRHESLEGTNEPAVSSQEIDPKALELLRKLRGT
ncbi:MAG: hypothetical protein K6T81_12615 [Alicyclobacillus macrosporangiidus]|uniref:hypothetical protein n=1 Tax=Alicyclobacillus macrosporangiidus TaxID=392015 RepID=UPI0026F372B4|nr:hypothetical protein [Alicyclobacillus macrosporangiidus]MCL6599566.1 hypothetical protein [Alicyclobacillus macrosporangiidus]